MGVTLKSIICQDASQIGVICEVNPEHVPYFALIPVCGFVDVIDGVDGSELIGISLDANSRVETMRQKIVHDLKSALSSWNINPSNINKRTKLAIMMVLQEGHHGHNSRRSDQNLQLIPCCQLDFLPVMTFLKNHHNCQ